MSASVLVRRIGLRHVLQHRLRAVLTVAGIAGAVALVFAVQVMNATLDDAVTGLPQAFEQDGRLVVAAPSSRGLDEEVVDTVRGTEGVSAAAPVLLSRTEVDAPGGTESVLVTGVTPDLLALGGEASEVRATGDFGSDGRGIVLAPELARRLDVTIGSAVEVTTPAGGVRLRATGTIDSSEVERINAGAVAVMELGAAQQVFERADRIDMVVVEGDGSGDDLRRRLERRLDGVALVGHSVDELSGAENVRPFTGLTTSIGFVALLVAGFVVLNTMGMSVAERRREHSLARALGATPRELRRAVLTEALVLGVVATVLGMAGGWFLARFLVDRASSSFAVQLSDAAVGDPVVPPAAVGGAVFAGVVVSLLGALWPALQSLRVAPAEAMRPVAPYEWRAATDRRRSPAKLVVGLLLMAAALASSTGGERRPLPVAVAAVLALLVGAILVVPPAVRAAVRGVRPFASAAGGVVGRLTVNEMSHNIRRTTTQIGVLVFSLGLVVALSGAVGAIVTQFNDLARDYISAPTYVESASTTSYVANQPLDRRLGEDLEAVPGVQAVLPGQTTFVVVDGQPSVLYANPISAAADAGVLDRMRDSHLADEPEAFLDGLRRGELVSSSRALDALGLDVGDDISLPTPTGPETFRIAASYDDIAAVPTFILDYDVYASRWQDGGAQRFQVMTEPGRESETLAAVRQFVRSDGLPVDVFSRQEAIDRNGRNLLRQFELAQAIQWAVLVLAGVSMAVTFFAGVVQRRWQHGLQRVLGMSSRQLGRTLLLEAGLSAVLGWLGAAVIGVALGWLVSAAASASLGASLPFHLPVTTVLLCLVAGFAVTFGAAAYPRWVALRAPVIEVVRNE